MSSVHSNLRKRPKEKVYEVPSSDEEQENASDIELRRVMRMSHRLHKERERTLQQQSDEEMKEACKLSLQSYETENRGRPKRMVGGSQNHPLVTVFYDKDDPVKANLRSRAANNEDRTDASSIKNSRNTVTARKSNKGSTFQRSSRGNPFKQDKLIDGDSPSGGSESTSMPSRSLTVSPFLCVNSSPEPDDKAQDWKDGLNNSCQRPSERNESPPGRSVMSDKPEPSPRHSGVQTPQRGAEAPQTTLSKSERNLRVILPRHRLRTARVQTSPVQKTAVERSPSVATPPPVIVLCGEDEEDGAGRLPFAKPLATERSTSVKPGTPHRRVLAKRMTPDRSTKDIKKEKGQQSLCKKRALFAQSDSDTETEPEKSIAAAPLCARKKTTRPGGEKTQNTLIIARRTLDLALLYGRLDTSEVVRSSSGDAHSRHRPADTPTMSSKSFRPQAQKTCTLPYSFLQLPTLASKESSNSSKEERQVRLHGDVNEKALPRCLLDAARQAKLFCPSGVCTDDCVQHELCQPHQLSKRVEAYSRVLVRLYELQRRRLRQLQRSFVEKESLLHRWKTDKHGHLCSPDKPEKVALAGVTATPSTMPSHSAVHDFVHKNWPDSTAQSTLETTEKEQKQTQIDTFSDSDSDTGTHSKQSPLSSPLSEACSPVKRRTAHKRFRTVSSDEDDFISSDMRTPKRPYTFSRIRQIPKSKAEASSQRSQSDLSDSKVIRGISQLESSCEDQLPECEDGSTRATGAPLQHDEVYSESIFRSPLSSGNKFETDRNLRALSPSPSRQEISLLDESDSPMSAESKWHESGNSVLKMTSSSRSGANVIESDEDRPMSPTFESEGESEEIPLPDNSCPKEKLVECPICNKHYQASIIQGHASNCTLERACVDESLPLSSHRVRRKSQRTTWIEAGVGEVNHPGQKRRRSIDSSDEDKKHSTQWHFVKKETPDNSGTRKLTTTRRHGRVGKTTGNS